MMLQYVPQENQTSILNYADLSVSHVCLAPLETNISLLYL